MKARKTLSQLRERRYEVHQEVSVKGAPPCRVLLGFEPAIAGGALPMDSALAQAYRVAHLRSDPVQ